jgi:hypothetical protein
LVDKYFMLNAAVATESYDASSFNVTVDGNYMLPDDWRSYNPRTWCSMWSTLFFDNRETDDRYKLSWGNRFSSVTTKAYNFFSSGDELFEIYPGTPSSFSGGLFHLEHYCWQKQEIFKGTQNLLGGTSWAGWGQDGGYPDYVAANAASDATLQSNPVFRHEPNSMFSSTIPPETINEIIAKGDPALSFAAGLNLIKGADNFNENGIERTNGWGRSGEPYHNRWLHSDIKNMAYPFIYDVFDTIVSRGDLK